MTSLQDAHKMLHARLDSFWEAVAALTPETPAAEIEKLTATYFAPGCTAYMGGMAAPPSHGPEGCAEFFKGLVRYWKAVERRVVSRSGSAEDGGRTVVAEMDNHLLIGGKPLEHFPETEIVTFDDRDLIASYRLYCDTAAVKALLSG